MTMLQWNTLPQGRGLISMAGWGYQVKIRGHPRKSPSSQCPDKLIAGKRVARAHPLWHAFATYTCYHDNCLALRKWLEARDDCRIAFQELVYFTQVARALANKSGNGKHHLCDTIKLTMQNARILFKGFSLTRTYKISYK